MDDFADMFAQTLTYGLFAARVNHNSAHGKFQRLGAAREIPRTNPFLRNLFGQITGLALDDEPFIGFVDDLVQLLTECDMESILEDFGRQAAREDPVVHFYETFLAAYDPELREKRGVYYTPEPVVSYIVRSVDYLLKERFGLAEGLADRSSTEYAVSTYVDTEERTSNDAKALRRVPRVLILDPAAGTGTFHYKVISLIREHYMQSNDAGMWSSYVREQLIPRLFGFELLMAPYAVAHLKLGMQLAGHDISEDARHAWRYDFASTERLNIFLTNTLEEGLKQTELTLGEFITQEANAAAEIKRDMPIMVVLGNPPYSGNSANRSRNDMGEKTWIGKLIDSYYEVDDQPLGEQNPKMLQDDYVKFIRFGQWRIERSGSGILAFVTNHSYLVNTTFRGMRQKLMQTFSDIFIVDLHGNSRQREQAPDGGQDENVFDIQQGVAIGIFVKDPGKSRPCRIHHTDIWGNRHEKYNWLAERFIASTQWTDVGAIPPFYLFSPQQGDYGTEYEYGWKVTDILPENSTGIKTHRDELVFDFDHESLESRITDFVDPANSDDTVRARYFSRKGSGKGLPGDTRVWQLGKRRRALHEDSEWRNKIVHCLYRPFDVRSLLHHSLVVDRGRWTIMDNFARGTNVGLAVGRAGQAVGSKQWEVLMCSAYPTDHNLFRRGSNNLMPLYLYPPRKEEPDSQQVMRNLSQWPEGQNGRRPNLDAAFVGGLEQQLGWTFVSDGKGNLGGMDPASCESNHGTLATFGPEDIFHYIYAILHAPSYRARYAEYLKIDFPRVPLTSDANLFATLALLGAKLVGLHTLDEKHLPNLNNPTISYPIRGTDEVARGHPRYLAPGELNPLTGEPLAVGRVYINASNSRKGISGQYFEGVPIEVWDFQIGGYQVCDKWLKDRRRRTLTNADLNHYRRIIVALQETIRTMEAIDYAIPGWPLPNEKLS